ELPEYYPTRTELAIMRQYAADMSALIGAGAALIEFGSGASTKTRLLIEAALPALYMPIDISESALAGACDALVQDFPWLNVCTVCADFTKPFDLPELPGGGSARRVAYFPGSTIGNFTPAEARGCLKIVREMVGRDGLLLVGVDLKKEKATLELAYDDPRGVTAAFNLNLLTRINRDLAGDFVLERFRHVAFYDPAVGRIEMHLESMADQWVAVAGRRFSCKRGETIHTEISCKYSVGEFQALGRGAGFDANRVWTDERAMFSVHALVGL
ncbi:MAG: L-histidine N(alpha)-methyltransferase, partial [Burkholderiales bacterium]